MSPQISVSKIALAAFCQEHGIRRLAIFGSALREDFGPESDIDVTGRKVDLRTPEALSPYSRQDVLVTAEVQYDQT